MRLRRSTLNIPGNDLKKIRAAVESEADVVMLDLEDSIPEPDKEDARECAAAALRELDFRGKVRCVRINEWLSAHAERDVRAVVAAGVDEIKMTKCEVPEEVLTLDRMLADFEVELGLPYHTVELSVMIESPMGVLNAYDILSSSERISSVSLGAGDIASALGVDRDMEQGALQLLYAKQKLSLTAHACGIHWVLDASLVPAKGLAPHEVLDTLYADCADMKKMGFTGRSALYPEHVDVINRVFSPSGEEECFARSVLNAWEKGLETGGGDCFTVEGRHIDRGKLNKAMRVVALAEAVADRKRLCSPTCRGGFSDGRCIDE